MRKEICITFLFGWKIYLLLHPLIHKMDLLRVHLKEDNMVTTYDYRHRKKENSTILSKYVWYLKENHINHSFEWKVLEWAKCFNPFTGKCRLFLLEKYFIMFNQKDATLNSRDVIFDILSHASTRQAIFYPIQRHDIQAAVGFFKKPIKTSNISFWYRTSHVSNNNHYVCRVWRLPKKHETVL